MNDDRNDDESKNRRIEVSIDDCIEDNEDEDDSGSNNFFDLVDE